MKMKKELSKEVESFLLKRSEALSAINNYCEGADSMLIVMLEWEYLSVCRLEENGIVKQFSFNLYGEDDGIGFECLESGRRFELNIENGDDIEVNSELKFNGVVVSATLN